MTASDIHRKIQEISSKYISGRPPISIDSLSSELGLSGPQLFPHLKHLETLGLIRNDDNSVIITESGINARLP